MENTKFLHFLESSMSQSDSTILLGTLKNILSGASTPKVINIYGPPRSGKTMLVRGLLDTFPLVFMELNPYTGIGECPLNGTTLFVDCYDPNTHSKNYLSSLKELGYHVFAVTLEPLDNVDLAIGMEYGIELGPNFLEDTSDIRITIQGLSWNHS